MTTLYKRATPSQFRILRAVEGAVKNAADAHPEYQIDRRFCRSVAKRAAGTITAQWGDVLAANLRLAPSDGAGGLSLVSPGPGRPASAEVMKRNARGASHTQRRSPLRVLHKRIAARMRWEKSRVDNEGRVEAFIEVLRMIDALEREASR